MKLRTLSVLLAFGLGLASAAALLASGTSAPAAVPGNEGKETPAPAQSNEGLMRRNGMADTCRDATWPYIPAGCLKNADPERQRRTVRVIPIHAPHVSN
jgi:hypothetical protein